MKTPDQPVIEKTLNNEASPEEAKEVVRWFGTPDGQKWLSDRMETDEKNMQENRESDSIDHTIPSDSMYDRIMEKIRKQKIRRLLLSVAAIVVPVILIAGLYVELNSRVDLFGTAKYDEVFVPKGEQVQIMFQDGSRVYLNSGSRLRYPRKFGMAQRKVELEGEGFFEIVQMKSRPFIVDLNLIEVKVLGTTFNASAYPEDKNITVSLETGLIELNGYTFKSFTIKPGESAVYDRSTGRCRIITPPHINTSSAWKENEIIFTDASLKEVIQVLSRTYDVNFEIENKDALKYHYTLRTKAPKITRVIEELEKIAPVKFKEKSEGNYGITIE